MNVGVLKKKKVRYVTNFEISKDVVDADHMTVGSFMSFGRSLGYW